MSDTKVTILVPNFKTMQITKLCLRLLRKYSDPEKVGIIVIDNDSQDESLEYLKQLNWIKLIERKQAPDDTPGLAHARALDLALEGVTSPYVLSIHTDTLVKRPDWLDVLLAEISKAPDIAGVGSWKLEVKPSLTKRIFKLLENTWRSGFYHMTGRSDKVAAIKAQMQSGYYKLFGRSDLPLEDTGKDYYFLRSHCALYRTDLLKRHNLAFSDRSQTAGKGIHQKLVRHGYRMVFLPSEYLSKFMVHLNHATMILHPELGSRKRTVKRGLKRIERELQNLKAKQILSDRSLDT